MEVKKINSECLSVTGSQDSIKDLDARFREHVRRLKKEDAEDISFDSAFCMFQSDEHNAKHTEHISNIGLSRILLNEQSSNLSAEEKRGFSAEMPERKNINSLHLNAVNRNEFVMDAGVKVENSPVIKGRARSTNAVTTLPGSDIGRLMPEYSDADHKVNAGSSTTSEHVTNSKKDNILSEHLKKDLITKKGEGAETKLKNSTEGVGNVSNVRANSAGAAVSSGSAGIDDADTDGLNAGSSPNTGTGDKHNNVLNMAQGHSSGVTQSTVHELSISSSRAEPEQKADSGLLQSHLAEQKNHKKNKLTYNFTEWGKGHQVDIQLGDNKIPHRVTPSDGIVQQRLADYQHEHKQKQPEWIFSEQEEEHSQHRGQQNGDEDRS